MIVRALDANGDWTYGTGQNNYLSGQAAAEQLIKTRILSFLGDCFFDSTSGIAWFSYLGSLNSELALNLAVSATILNTTDENGNQIVTGMQQLSIVLNRQSRNLSVSYQAVTIYSVITSAFSYDLNGSS